MRHASPAFAISGSSAQCLDDLPRFRIAAFPVLGKNQRAVGGHVEHAAATRDELGLHSEPFGDRGRQTGGPGQIVSNRAIGDGDAHGCFLIREFVLEALLRASRDTRKARVPAPALRAAPPRGGGASRLLFYPHDPTAPQAVQKSQPSLRMTV